MAQNEGLLYYSSEIDELPVLQCAPFDLHIHASYSGPDIGAAMIEQHYAPDQSDKETSHSLDNKDACRTHSELNELQSGDGTCAKTKGIGDFTKRIKQKLKRDTSKTSQTERVQRWTTKNRKAYGMSVSLYDVHPVNGKYTMIVQRMPGHVRGNVWMLDSQCGVVVH